MVLVTIVPSGASAAALSHESRWAPYSDTVTESSTSGWYPDPEGRAGLERWWNGLSWSEDVRAAPRSGGTLTAQDVAPTAYPNPYEISGSADVGYPASVEQLWSAGPSQTRTTGEGGPTRGGVASAAGNAWIGWLVGAVALVLLMTVVVFVGGSKDPAPAPTTGAVPSATPSRPPGQTRVIDEAAGVAYPFLGPYWLEFVNEVAETTSTAGEYIVTQDVVPSGGQFIAQVTSGPLQATFGYSGPSSFAGTIAEVQQSVRVGYYPAPNTIETLRDEPVTIDGASAYLLEFDLAWDVPGYDSTGERAALILIETGRAAAALVYISIPNTHAELYGVVDRVIAELDVLD